MSFGSSGLSEPLEGADTRLPAWQAVADPAPLGLAGFAMTTFALSIGNTNVWGAGGKAALALALAYGGIVQLLAGMWEFRRGNTFGALAFSSYGAFWIAYYVLVTSVLPGIKNPDDASVAVGVFLLGWTVFTAYMTVASLRVSGSVALVFVLLTATFVLLTIAAFHDSTSLTKAGGWVGVATAVAAWYASFAGVVNETFKKTVLPTLPLAPRALPPATTTTSTPARP